MSNNPGVLISTGSKSPFYTAPNGTTVPDNAGVQIDITGVPLTVAPATNAQQSGVKASVFSVVGITTTLSGLTGMTPQSVGRKMVVNGAANVGNNGTFVITAYINPSTVQVNSPIGSAPDANSGSIIWTELVAPGDFPPGDPLSAVARNPGIPLTLNEPGDAFRFGDYNPILPAQVPNASPSMGTGQSNPAVPGAAVGMFAPIDNDIQNPVRLAPSALFETNAQGENAPMSDGPASIALGASVPVAGAPAFGSGNMITKTVGQVVFSKSV